MTIEERERVGRSVWEVNGGGGAVEEADVPRRRGGGGRKCLFFHWNVRKPPSQLIWPGGAALRENLRGFVLRIVDGYHQKQAGALIAASGMCMTMEGSQRVVYGREGVHACLHAGS